ncbi:ComEA family DNA-binding protein [Maribacter sp. X9]|uniref:ComEA family DNA-binding protein n=1 Tax=Maribacter sp. X9 TaxID=3402159 RepID=UPI003AF371F4
MNFKSHFKFNKQERSGIFFLLFFLIVIQVGYFFYDAMKIKESDLLIFDGETQEKVDSLKKLAFKVDSIKIFPFNPNFITDYKGYALGMSIDEIDRLHDFRAGDKFVNSKEEFQKVTLVSDSLLNLISPYFKFPEWIKTNASKKRDDRSLHRPYTVSKAVEPKDLNKATAEELRRINGVGEKLSARIIKFRDKLGGFLVDEQLYDVYYLEPEVVQKVLKEFKVITKPKIVKINVNTGTVEELAKLTYLQKSLAQRIVDYRNLNGGIDSLIELKKIEGFPAERIDRIALYLSL